MEDVTYQLKNSFEYARGGTMEKAIFITLLTPTGRHITDIAPIKSSILKAISWSQNQESDSNNTGEGTGEGNDAESIGPDVMMTTLDLTPGVDIAKVLLHVNAMLTGGLAKIDGDTRYTKPIADNLSIEDTYGLAGCFLVNFILPSL